MSTRILTKLTPFTLALTITLSAAYHYDNIQGNNQADLITSCMAVESNLPMNHSSHPCNATYMPNKSWISWLSNENKSAHLHFLDLVELLHYSFH